MLQRTTPRTIQCVSSVGNEGGECTLGDGPSPLRGDVCGGRVQDAAVEDHGLADCAVGGVVVLPLIVGPILLSTRPAELQTSPTRVHVALLPR